ncbi:MAG: hypothetical protein JSV78_12995 [Phycisphaerales bacterium]|nr:MAG: hypothetical protein JSV78_12995 [Phycisphaerales bacterium]
MHGFGGLVLFCTFFMPAITVCNSAYVPFQLVCDLPSPWGSDPLEWAWVLVVCVGPYLFGLLCTIAAIRGFAARTGERKRTGRPAIVVFGIVLLYVVSATVIEVLDQIGGGSFPSVDFGELIFVGIIVVSSFYYVRAIRRGGPAMLALRWYAALCCVLWFGHFFVVDFSEVCYGMYVSMAGSLMIVAGLFGEAQALLGLGFRDTLKALLTCRMMIYDPARPTCVYCGYLLIGLPEPRCPECGTPYRWEDYGLEPATWPTSFDACDSGPCNRSAIVDPTVEGSRGRRLPR